MKDELRRKIMTQVSALRPETYGNLTDDSNENKKVRNTKSIS